MPARRLAEAAAFARLSEDIMRDADETLTLHRVAERCVVAVPACDHASVSLHRRKVQDGVVAASSELAERCASLERDLAEGPSVEVSSSGDCHLICDTSQADRWPAWAGAVAAEGVGSLLSIRLATADANLGALNLYAEASDAFTEDDLDAALVFASHAAVALNSARQVTGLQAAVASRHLIGVAQGILMVQHDLDVEQTFQLLRRYSSTSNVKLRELAAEVVRCRGMPGMDGVATAPETSTVPDPDSPTRR